MGSKPTTLFDVGQIVANGGDYTCAMKEFIDSVIARVMADPPAPGQPFPIPSIAYAAKPPHLENDVFRAHLAGMAEYLASLAASPAPEWSEAPDCFLPTPVCFGGTRGRQFMVGDTPVAFQRRQLFCGTALAKLHAILRVRPRSFL